MLALPNARKFFDPLTVVRLPARLDADNTARVLGFAAHDIPVLVQAKLLQPLGKPPPNGTKYFSAIAIEELRADHNWLNAATRTITQHWQRKNAAQTPRGIPEPSEV